MYHRVVSSCAKNLLIKDLHCEDDGQLGYLLFISLELVKKMNNCKD